MNHRPSTRGDGGDDVFMLHLTSSSTKRNDDDAGIGTALLGNWLRCDTMNPEEDEVFNFLHQSLGTIDMQARVTL